MKKKYDVLSAGWAIVILILCGIPGRKIPHISFIDWLRPDKIVHICLFGIQSVLLISALSLRGNTGNGESGKWPGVFISIFYGIIIEVLQNCVFINRSADFMDIIANSIGAFLGLVFFNLYWRKKINL